MIIMNYTRVSAITGSVLASLLREAADCVAVIDCRPFIAYNSGHVKSAINICCPSLLRRRLKKGSVSLETLISCQTTLKFLRDTEITSIVLYDESTLNHSDDEQSSSTVNVIATLLANELKKKTYYLKGGFLDFKEGHRNMCDCPQQQATRAAVTATARTVRGPATLHLDFNKRNRDEARAADEEGGEKSAPVEILPFLYLGNESHCARKEALEKLGITAVINVSKTINNHFQDHFIYKNVPVDDTYSADISRWFRIAVDFIDSVEISGGKVLIHCQAGISRSATICLAYLMSKRRCSLEEAYEYVKERRPVISPNFNFMGQLLTWEREVKAINAMSPDKLSPSQPPCGLFSYSAITNSTDTGLHSNNCFVTVSTPT